MTLGEEITLLCNNAKSAAGMLALATTEQKNRVLARLSEILRERAEELVSANGEDLEAAQENGVPNAMLDRLTITPTRIAGICRSLETLITLEDPVGKGESWTRPSGLTISRVRVPLGVVAMIYEARPNVTVDSAALCIKTGNAVILRGGKEAIHTNMALVSCIKQALNDCDLDPHAVELVASTERESAQILMTMRGYVDVLIPRGGKGLIRSVVENATVPVIETGAGNCHLFVDASADIDMAIKVAINAKCSRPAVCNAIETMLVHRDIAADFLLAFKAAVDEKYSLELRGCERTRAILGGITPATDEDFATEYDDFILAVKIVDTLDEAIAHINKYNTGHSESIITRDEQNAEKFRRHVDAAAVYVNASTRFTDGGEFGFGAEIGISTQKLHARGPMGLSALTTQKYLIRGDGQVR